MSRTLRIFIVAMGISGAAVAHHSFAVFFESDRMVTIEGAVTDFQFRNPHGVIRLRVNDAGGEIVVWKAETNSPSILERRGWKRDSLKPGDQIRIEGWPARDGSRYLRMRSVVRSDGSPVGVPFESAEQK